MFLLFESALRDQAGVAIPALLVVGSIAWWNVMPLLKEESDDFSGDRSAR